MARSDIKNMHKIRWTIAIAALAVLATVIVVATQASGKKHVTPPILPEVTVAQVIVRPVQPSREFSGHIEAVNTVKLRPRVDGYIESIHFQEGDLVNKGELLFQIDPRPYQDDVTQLEAKLTQAKAQLNLDEDNAKRARKLIGKGVISRKQAQTLETKAKSSRALVQAAKAALNAARLRLGFTQVRSPINGRIGKALITPGNLVTSNDVLTTVVTTSPVYVNFNIDEHSYLNLLHSGLLNAGKASIPVTMGLADEQGFPHTGRLDYVGNQLHDGTGTIELRAVFANKDGELTPGLYARIELPVGHAHSRVLIDDQAVGSSLNSRYVYVVGKNGKIQSRNVKLGPLLHGLRVVRKGLKPGDVIVVNGLQHVRPGMKVNATRVAMGHQDNDSKHSLAKNSAPS